MSKKKIAPKKAKVSFKAGQQVAVNSNRHGLRFGYEYAGATPRHHKVRNIETGKVSHVWFDKVLGMKSARKLAREIDTYNAQFEKKSA